MMQRKKKEEEKTGSLPSDISHPVSRQTQLLKTREDDRQFNVSEVVHLKTCTSTESRAPDRVLEKSFIQLLLKDGAVDRMFV